MLVDCHTHLQPHGAQPPMTRALIERYVAAGRDRGVERMAITEHLFRFREAYELLHGWWDDDPDGHVAGLAQTYWQDHVSASVADYVRLIEDAKRDGMPVLLGIEMDWIGGREDELRRFLAPYDWDIVVGAVHYIGAWGFDAEEFIDEWAKRDIDGVWASYGALVGDLAESGLADVIAHPDVPKVFGHRPSDETPLHAAIVNAAAVNGTAIELNSNGLNKACAEVYPTLSLIERARAAGLPITLASDAHVPERVGADFADLVSLARAAGYDEASWFEARARQTYRLP